MNTREDIEDAMADVLLRNQYAALEAEYERLLSIMGNVDGNEVIALIIVAAIRTRFPTE